MDEQRSTLQNREQLRTLLQGPAAWLLRLISTYEQGKHSIQWLLTPDAPMAVEKIETAFFNSELSETLAGLSALPLSDEDKQEQQEQSQHFVVVGRGPKTPSVLATDELRALQSWICLDLRQPDQLWLALDSDYPPFLWIPLGNTVKQMHEVLALYFPGPQSSVPETQLTGCVRWLFQQKATTDATLKSFEDRAVFHSLINASYFWGSAYATDPYMRPGTAETLAKGVPYVSLLMHEYMQQSSERIPSSSHRSSHTQAVITFEEHYDFWVIQIRYRPMPLAQQQPLLAAQERYGWPFPPDAPVDIIPECWELYPSDSAHIGPLTQEEWQALDPFARAYLLLIMGVLGGPGMLKKLPFVLNDPALSVRWMALLVARWHGLHDYLRQMSAHEHDPALQQALATALTVSGTHVPLPIRPGPSSARKTTRIRLNLKQVYRFHLMAVAWMEGWLWLNPGGPEDYDEQGIRTILWGLPGQDTQIAYAIYGGALKNGNDRHLLILDGEQVGSLAVRLRELLPIYTFAEIASMIEQAEQREEMIDALELLNMEFPQYASQPHLDLLARLLVHPDTVIRQGAIRAMKPVFWPEFIGLLKPVLANDPDPTVRIAATQMITSIEEYHAQS